MKNEALKALDQIIHTQAIYVDDEIQGYINTIRAALTKSADPVTCDGASNAGVSEDERVKKLAEIEDSYLSVLALMFDELPAAEEAQDFLLKYNLSDVFDELQRWRSSHWENGKFNPDYCVARDALKENLRTALQDREWQPIETAPRDGTKFIGAKFDGYSEERFDCVSLWWQPDFDAWIHSCRQHTLYKGYTFEDGSTSQLHSPEIYNPSHWMPLPSPPKKQEENNYQ